MYTIFLIKSQRYKTVIYVCSKVPAEAIYLALC